MKKPKSLVVKEPFRTDVGGRFTLYEGEVGTASTPCVAEIPVNGYSAAAVERARRWAHRLSAAPDMEETLEALADFVEQTYRQSCGLASKAEKDRAVEEHALLKPARAALAKAKGGGG